MGYLKGKSMQPKIQIWEQKFWCRGYYVDTIEKNEKKIKEDYYTDQVSIK